MKNVLVTGGAGFVGRHLVKRLLSLGCTVHIVDDLSTGVMPEINTDDPSLDLFEMDCREYFRRFENTYDTIFHCAAVVGGRLTIEGAPLRVATDLSVDSEFFNWLAKQKDRPNKVVYFSSSAVYPIQLQRKGQHCALSENYVDFKANKIGMPDQTYGFAKFAGEYLAQFAAKNYGIDVVCYRPFSGYGEDQSLDYPFMSILNRVRNRENPLTIWGSGDQERDFIHIEDCVSAVLATMNVLQPGEALNLGTGVATSFKQLAQLACAAEGLYGTLIYTDTTKPEGVFSRVCDPYKLHQWYVPQVTIRRGVEMALDALDMERKVS